MNKIVNKQFFLTLIHILGLGSAPDGALLFFMLKSSYERSVELSERN